MKIDAPWLSGAEIHTLAAAFLHAGFELRFVGGCVRDTILGRTFHEIDAATDATPEQMMALLGAAHLRAIPTGIKHGTITALVNEKSFEITTLRSDITTDGRHAEVAFTDSWEEDAARRDFTMNALYLGMDGTLYDYVNGLEDCKTRRVKFIGDASERIGEDYLRILRYFRFVASVGNNQFDAAALAACATNKEGIAQLSGERIQQELLKLLAAENAHIALEKLLPLLPPPLSSLRKRESSLTKLDTQHAPALLKLAALIGDAASISTVAERLKLSAKQSKKLELWLSHAPLISPTMSELAQKKLVRKLGREDYIAVVQLAYAFSTPSPLEGEGWGGGWEQLTKMAAWTPPKFPITAADLMAQGYKEGKELGDKLKELEAQWEENNYQL